ncbi:hypothetical protein RSOLAG22IIIB_00986 [Rhizoctonia solani]|uniref:Expansin-like EG45 domain-containing protein n=1 Tax=Rhizoctonia solani TaxID=456999 RepID=A0A0K6G1C6_9AGAM|nr:hypothetical protein RSOLAG22IIIB_00986 [Rhizoctonia solani]
MFAFSTLALAASLVATVAADHGHGLHVRSPHHVGRSNLQKRYDGRATYYAVGMGACGQTNVPSDFIVALNSAQFGSGYPGPNCFKPITICKDGKCTGATIMDECPSCPYGGLDLSEGLFKYFADTSVGVFQMTWTFDGDSPAPTSTKKPDPTTTKKPDPEPTTTWKPEPTTSWEEPTTTSSKKKTSTWSPPPETTSTPEPTTSSTSTSSTPTTTSSSTSTVAPTTTSAASTSVPVTTSATSTSSMSSASSGSAAPSASAGSPSSASGNNSGSGSGSNLADAQQVMIALGRMVVAAHQ